MRRKDLEDRLIRFSVTVLEIADKLPNNKAGNHLSGQLVRSGSSVSLNYGEAQSGESRKDFIHKMQKSKIVNFTSPPILTGGWENATLI